MTAPFRPLASLLLLALASCQPTGEGAGASELAAKLDATEQRLAAVETKLDALDTTLDETVKSLMPLVEQAQAAQVEEAEREARRVEREAFRAEQEARRAEQRARLGVLEEDLDTGLDPEEPPSGREIEGAAEGIECREAKGDRWECTIDRAFIDHVLANPALLAKQARVVPSLRDGETRGYRLYGIRPGTLPKLLSFKNGDMITAVNGTPLDSIDAAMELYTKLRKAKSFEIEIERKGVLMVLALDIVK